MKEFLTVKEYAALFDFHWQTVLNHIRVGLIKDVIRLPLSWRSGKPRILIRYPFHGIPPLTRDHREFLFIRLATLAKVLDVTTDYLRSEAEVGRLQTVKMGRLRYMSLRMVERWLDERIRQSKIPKEYRLKVKIKSMPELVETHLHDKLEAFRQIEPNVIRRRRMERTQLKAAAPAE